jgi:hypothetical protein
MTAKTTRQTGPCSASSQDFEHDAGKVPPANPFNAVAIHDVTLECPCCKFVSEAKHFRDAPSVTRGPIAMVMAKKGLTPAQISQVTGWKRSTVRSLLWYQRNIAKVKP